MCGGEFLQDCHDFINGQWTRTPSFSKVRYHHSSWQAQDGRTLYLGGAGLGIGKETTTEILSGRCGVSTPGFSLEYEIW